MLLVVALTCCPVQLAAWDRDVGVIETDDHGLTVEITAPAPALESLDREQDPAYNLVLVPGWARSDRAGTPDLPVKSFLVQVPGAGNVEARVLEVVEQPLAAGRVAPVLTRALLEDGRIGESLDEDERVYGAHGLFPSNLVDLGPREVCRGVPVVRVTVHPYRWNPASGELRVSRMLRLRIVFEEALDPGLSGGGTAASRRSGGGEYPFDGLLRGTVVNYRGLGGVSGVSAAPLPTATPAQDSQPLQRLRVEVREEGIYRVSYEDLATAGFFARNAAPRSFRLHNQGQEVALEVVSRSGSHRFSPGDFIEFYGHGLDTRFTETNVYWLSVQGGDGKRVSRIDGRVTGGGALVDAFRETIRWEENHTFWEATPGTPEADAWFWERMTAPASKSLTRDVPWPASDPDGAVVRVCFQGRSTAGPHPNHRTTIGLNGTQIGQALWDGAVVHVQEAEVPAGLIQSGPNTLVIGLPGGTGAPLDVVYFNWAEVEYTRALKAVDGRLRFSLSGTGRVEVSVGNLDGPDVRIYDVTDPPDVKEIVGHTVEACGERYCAGFEDDLDGTTAYLVLNESRVAVPAEVSTRMNPFLRSPLIGADYLLITPREFVPATWPLVLLRRVQGLRVRVVSVEDIFDTFGHGLPTPQAIRDFLRFAYETWIPPAPVYVLLLGDASTDYRGFLATGKKSRVPVHLSVTSGLGLTPDDNWYASVDGDDALPDLFIGRVPAASRQAAAEAVWKIFLYELLPRSVPPGALFAADDNTVDFENLNEALIAYLPEGFALDRVYLRQYERVEHATEDILRSLNQGRLIATYTGHGAVTNWAGEFMFQSSDVSRLQNAGQLPFVVTLTCLNGYFSHFSHYSLAETFVAEPFKGAVASFSPSGLGYTWEHRILGNELFSSLFEEGTRCLGSLTTESKIAAYARGATEDLLRTFTLLGDPALRLKSWE